MPPATRLVSDGSLALLADISEASGRSRWRCLLDQRSSSGTSRSACRIRDRWNHAVAQAPRPPPSDRKRQPARCGSQPAEAAPTPARATGSGAKASVPSRLPCALDARTSGWAQRPNVRDLGRAGLPVQSFDGSAVLVGVRSWVSGHALTCSWRNRLSSSADMDYVSSVERGHQLAVGLVAPRQLLDRDPDLLNDALAHLEHRAGAANRRDVPVVQANPE